MYAYAHPRHHIHTFKQTDVCICAPKAPYTYIQTDRCMYMCTRGTIQNVCICAPKAPCTYVHICVHVYMCTYAHPRHHARLYTDILYIHIHTYVHICAPKAPRPQGHRCPITYILTSYIYIYTHIYIYIYIYEFVYTSCKNNKRVYVCICIPGVSRVCRCICVYI